VIFYRTHKTCTCRKVVFSELTKLALAKLALSKLALAKLALAKLALAKLALAKLALAKLALAKLASELASPIYNLGWFISHYWHCCSY
jgi:hypothetical protein